MTSRQNKELDLSNSISFPIQHEKTYQNTLDFYLGKSSEICFANPSSNSIEKKAGTQPTKQIIHKMIERQRRKDMNALYSELRSLLPEESIRGKRSVTDQLEEAVNYARCLENNIKDLTKEREKKKTLADCSKGVEKSKPHEFHESDEGFPSVKIKSFGSSAFQVYINSIQNQIALSDILMVLEEWRVEIVNVASSVTDESVFHTIHAKVTDPSNTDLNALYVKLQRLIGKTKKIIFLYCY